MFLKSIALPLALAFAVVAAPTFYSLPLPAAEEKGEHKHAEGADHKLGDITLNGTVFTVELEGALEAGKEVEIKITTKGTFPAGVLRGWIGVESGKGSAKGKAHKEDDGMCIHTEAPNPITADTLIWIELDVDGNKSKAGLKIPKH
jgi:hypothetical protein